MNVVAKIAVEQKDVSLIAQLESEVYDGQVSVWRCNTADPKDGKKKIIVAWRGTDSATDAMLDLQAVFQVPFHSSRKVAELEERDYIETVVGA